MPDKLEFGFFNNVVKSKIMWYTVCKGCECMIDFKPLELSQKNEFDNFLKSCPERGCEYNFANLFLWGRQKVAQHEGNLAFFSQFNRKSVYPFPLGKNLKHTIDAIIHDAKMRGIPCRLTSLTQAECALLEEMHPGKFRFHGDRDSFDYVYSIQDLATLAGRKYQRKRNHFNRFRQSHPNYTVAPITDENTTEVSKLLDTWYDQRLSADPYADFHMERSALKKALQYRKELGMEGLVLMDEGKLLAMTMGSALSAETFDVQFEKALEEADGAYPAINCEFARYLQAKYPALQWLNREEDLGLEGLRKAKLSYNPHHFIEKHWACLLEDGYDY